MNPHFSRSLNEGKKRSVYITRATRVQVVAFEMKILTDLGTVAAQAYQDVPDWRAQLLTKEVRLQMFLECSTSARSFHRKLVSVTSLLNCYNT